MPTRSELHVRILPPANIAPGSAGTHRKRTALPSAAPPTHSGTRRAMPPMPALSPPASVSCHEKEATVAVLRTYYTKTTSFTHFLSKNDRELTATASCYESLCHYPVTRREKKLQILAPFGQNRPFDTLSIPDFPKPRSRFASHPDAPGPTLDGFGPILAHLRGFTDKETDAATDFNPGFDPGFDPDSGTRRRCGPRRGPLRARKAGSLHPRHRPIPGRIPRSATKEPGGHPPPSPASSLPLLLSLTLL